MDNYDIEITFKATNKKTGQVSVTTQTYQESSYPSMLAIQKALILALISLGEQKIAAEGK